MKIVSFFSVRAAKICVSAASRALFSYSWKQGHKELLWSLVSPANKRFNMLHCNRRAEANTISEVKVCWARAVQSAGTVMERCMDQEDKSRKYYIYFLADGEIAAKVNAVLFTGRNQAKQMTDRRMEKADWGTSMRYYILHFVLFSWSRNCRKCWMEGKSKWWRL